MERFTSYISERTEKHTSSLSKMTSTKDLALVETLADHDSRNVNNADMTKLQRSPKERRRKKQAQTSRPPKDQCTLKLDSGRDLNRSRKSISSPASSDKNKTKTKKKSSEKQLQDGLNCRSSHRDHSKEHLASEAASRKSKRGLQKQSVGTEGDTVVTNATYSITEASLTDSLSLGVKSSQLERAQAPSEKPVIHTLQDETDDGTPVPTLLAKSSLHSPLKHRVPKGLVLEDCSVESDRLQLVDRIPNTVSCQEVSTGDSVSLSSIVSNLTPGLSSPERDEKRKTRPLSPDKLKRSTAPIPFSSDHSSSGEILTDSSSLASMRLKARIMQMSETFRKSTRSLPLNPNLLSDEEDCDSEQGTPSNVNVKSLEEAEICSKSRSKSKKPSKMKSQTQTTRTNESPKDTSSCRGSSSVSSKASKVPKSPKSRSGVSGQATGQAPDSSKVVKSTTRSKTMISRSKENVNKKARKTRNGISKVKKKGKRKPRSLVHPEKISSWQIRQQQKHRVMPTASLYSQYLDDEDDNLLPAFRRRKSKTLKSQAKKDEKHKTKASDNAQRTSAFQHPTIQE